MIVVTSFGILYYKLQQGFFNRTLFFESLREFVVGLKADEAWKALVGKN